MYCLAAGVYSRHTKEELKNLFKELDLVMVDLDGCIFPGITNIAIYKNICLLLIRSRKLRNYALLSRLLIGGSILCLMKIIQILHLGITNRHLILCFASIIRRVPVPYLQQAAESIPYKSYAAARETLKILSKKARLGIISQALDIVLNEYVKQFNNGKENVIDFWDGNTLPDLFGFRKRVNTTTFIFNKSDKEAPARKRITQFNPRKIMVIGHNTDDLGMIKSAMEQNGIIIGFNPTSQIKKICDIVIREKNWVGFKKLIQEII